MTNSQTFQSSSKVNRPRTLGFLDDELSFLEELQDEFNDRTGLSALYSSELTDAVKWVENNEVDTVVSDLRMDTLDGLDVLNIIRKMNTKIELVLLTGFVLNEEEEKACKAMEINVLFKQQGYDNIIRNILDIREHSTKRNKLFFGSVKRSEVKNNNKADPVLDLARKELMNLEKEKYELIKKEIIEPISQEMISNFRKIKTQDYPIYIEGNKQITIEGLINEVENLTPLGIQHIRMWVDMNVMIKSTEKIRKIRK